MTTYTQAEQFTSSTGWKMFWHRGALHVGAYEIPRSAFVAISEFIEAERNADWAWMNDAHTKPEILPDPGTWVECEYRSHINGPIAIARGLVKRVGDHYDVGGCYVGYPLSHAPDKDITRLLDWHPIDPPQPEEPTGLGAVVVVADEQFLRDHRGDWYASKNGPYAWEEVTQLGPVTIESPGVVL